MCNFNLVEFVTYGKELDSLSCYISHFTCSFIGFSLMRRLVLYLIGLDQINYCGKFVLIIFLIEEKGPINFGLDAMYVIN